MQDDFHYYCIAKLAYYAGFPKNDALIIGHASALVDYCDRERKFEFSHDDEYQPLKTQSILSFESLEEETFVASYFPFHFIPRRENGYLNNPKDFTTYSYNENDTAQNLFQFVINNISKDDNKEKAIIRLGIALHALADTYSHSTFSATKNDTNLLPETFKVSYDNGSTYKTFKGPRINLGHASSFSTPDTPSAIWERHKDIFINNTEEKFKPAIKTIYGLLIQAKDAINDNKAFKTTNYNEPTKSFDSIKDEIFETLFCNNSPEIRDKKLKRIKLWINKDKDDLFTKKFDDDEWEDELIELQNPPQFYKKGNKYNNDLERRVYPYLSYEEFEQTKIYKFYQAAYDHRNFVLEFLKSGKTDIADSKADENIAYFIDLVKECEAEAQIT